MCKLFCNSINLKIGFVGPSTVSCSYCKCKSGQYIVDEYGNCNYWCSKSGYCGDTSTHKKGVDCRSCEEGFDGVSIEEGSIIVL